MQDSSLISSSRCSFATVRILSQALLWTVLFIGSLAFAEDEFERAPILYSETASHDRIQLLQAKIAANDVTLDWSDTHGWLPSLLKQLEVPPTSQALVFSKTSLQIDRISPKQPRAIYFSDDVYVGWVQGGRRLEL